MEDCGQSSQAGKFGCSASELSAQEQGKDALFKGESMFTPITRLRAVIFTTHHLHTQHNLYVHI